MPLQATSGAASYDAFGGGTAAKVNYIEDFFQSYLRTGTGASATVTTGLDGSTKETLVWTKSRSAATNHKLTENGRGATKALSSNTTGAEVTDSQGLTAFSSTGYTIGTNADYNNSGATYVDWQWVSQPKFFDVVTYTGTGSNTTIAHSLGAVPGSIIVKRTDTTAAWAVYHRSLANTEYLVLNTTAAKATGTTWWNSTTPTSAVFSVGTDATVNASGGTYVAYLFAHDAGGFGLTGTDNVISCGSFTTTTSPDTVTLGYEPQWVLIKSANSATNWYIFDNMRGIPTGGLDSRLMPNLSAAESTDANYLDLTATGFTSNFQSIFGDGINLIYIAIRRGPMKVPTTGTSVFSPFTTAAATGTAVTTNFPVDFQLYKYRAGVDYWFDVDRLRGVNSTTTANSTPWLDTTATTAEATATNVSRNWGNTGFEVPGIVGGASNVFYSFRRAPSFFDEVCVTTSGYEVTATHNLGVRPELIIGKARNQTGVWVVWVSAVAALNINNTLILNTTASATNNGMPINTVTATSFYAAIAGVPVETEVFYLFATCPGVSKVGSYTGNGTTQTINCGFTAGARFVLLKRTDAAGDWYTYDTARGMTTSTDPYLRLNSTAAEVATAGSVTTVSTGFALNSAVLAAINVSGGTYIFLAIA